MPRWTTVAIEEIEPRDVIAGGPDGIACTVLRVEPGVETVAPLAGRPCIRLWCEGRIDGLLTVGYVTYGPGGRVTKRVDNDR